MNIDPASGKVILVTGAAKSGKSEWAETLALQSGKSVFYVATAKVEEAIAAQGSLPENDDSVDREWLLRIEQHRHRRPCEWVTLEVPHNLVETIKSTPESCCLLVDSLGTWVANLLESDSTTWERTQENLIFNLEQIGNKDVIIVAEETGWGVVPAYSSGRLFRDRLGNLVRRLGAIADPVYLVAGGHVLNLSTLGFPLPVKR